MRRTGGELWEPGGGLMENWCKIGGSWGGTEEEGGELGETAGE